jgi:hypothetical protein
MDRHDGYLPTAGLNEVHVGADSNPIWVGWIGTNLPCHAVSGNVERFGGFWQHRVTADKLTWLTYWAIRRSMDPSEQAFPEYAASTAAVCLKSEPCLVVVARQYMYLCCPCQLNCP